MGTSIHTADAVRESQRIQTNPVIIGLLAFAGAMALPLSSPLLTAEGRMEVVSALNDVVAKVETALEMGTEESK